MTIVARQPELVDKEIRERGLELKRTFKLTPMTTKNQMAYLAAQALGVTAFNLQGTTLEVLSRIADNGGGLIRLNDVEMRCFGPKLGLAATRAPVEGK